jgi:hypothetical protein
LCVCLELCVCVCVVVEEEDVNNKKSRKKTIRKSNMRSKWKTRVFGIPTLANHQW